MTKRPRIIGLSGTNGSGKDTVGHLLADRHGYLFVSVTELLRDQAKRRGLPVERKHLRQISAEWRRESGLGVLVDKAVAEFEKQPDEYAGVVMASLRNPGEADEIHKLGGTMVWIDADPRVRYERIQVNAHQRGRGAEDNKTFQEFQAEETVEMNHTGDAATLNMLAVKQRADVFIQNDTTDVEAFARQVDQALGL